MAFCCFLVVRVQALSELLGLASELRYFLEASFELLKCCPGFVSYGADAQARHQRFFGYLPGCIILKTCEDAGSCSADKELAPGYFSFISVYFSQLEPLF